MLYGAKYEALVDAVKGHAVRNYEKDGWDYIVECYGDEDIAALIEAADATTREEAIKAVGDYISDMQCWRLMHQ